MDINFSDLGGEGFDPSIIDSLPPQVSPYPDQNNPPDGGQVSPYPQAGSGAAGAEDPSTMNMMGFGGYAPLAQNMPMQYAPAQPAPAQVAQRAAGAGQPMPLQLAQPQLMPVGGSAQPTNYPGQP